MGKKSRPMCPYCGDPAEFLENSAVLYHGTDYGPTWRCFNCSAWVGCHKGTKRPLGRLANAELRSAKMAAHAAFDRLWKAKIRRDQCSKKAARGAGYRWLAAQLGIDPKDCHIGMMDADLCRRVVAVCEAPRCAPKAG